MTLLVAACYQTWRQPEVAIGQPQQPCDGTPIPAQTSKVYTGFFSVYKFKLRSARQPFVVLWPSCSCGKGDHDSGEGAFTQASKRLCSSTTAYLLIYMLCLGAVSQAKSRLTLQSQAQRTADAVLIIIHKSMLIYNASRVL